MHVSVICNVTIGGTTLSVIVPSRSLSLMIWRAVGRASPGPLRFSALCTSEYRPDIFTDEFAKVRYLTKEGDKYDARSECFVINDKLMKM